MAFRLVHVGCNIRNYLFGQEQSKIETSVDFFSIFDFRKAPGAGQFPFAFCSIVRGGLYFVRILNRKSVRTHVEMGRSHGLFKGGDQNRNIGRYFEFLIISANAI